MTSSHDDGRAERSGRPGHPPQPLRLGANLNPGGLRGFFVHLPTTTWLIIVNVAVYAVTAAQSGSLSGNYDRSSVFLSTALFGPSVARGQWWRLLTSAFEHFGPWHLFANMWMLLILGLGVERAITSIRYLGIYIASVLAGSAAALWMTSTSIIAGASGGVFGVMGAWAVIATAYRLKPQGLLVLIGLNIVISIVVPGISLAGHIGGLLGGAVAAAVMIVLPQFAARRLTPRSREILAWALWFVLLVALFFAGMMAALA